ncbi:hypothetical protein [Lyticum sinuosum]|uniref:Uncharacterized protein n=1 Tax=Lyticum sinuosum TaxID=1332059 RepID=A0AAE4VMG4_9RICK|nr:hypothetical protein [Lyticum sinuosum]MDZ5761484.1 hypothetical protein [Lyticum sinuosum]
MQNNQRIPDEQQKQDFLKLYEIYLKYSIIPNQNNNNVRLNNILLDLQIFSGRFIINSFNEILHIQSNNINIDDQKYINIDDMNTSLSLHVEYFLNGDIIQNIKMNAKNSSESLLKKTANEIGQEQINDIKTFLSISKKYNIINQENYHLETLKYNLIDRFCPIKAYINRKRNTIMVLRTAIKNADKKISNIPAILHSYSVMIFCIFIYKSYSICNRIGKGIAKIFTSKNNNNSIRR